MKGEYELYKDRNTIIEEKFSSSFCFAKWYFANIFLHTGQSKSCHHPPNHEIDVQTIQHTPSALHNTEFKINERKQMLEGKRPPGCQYCWSIEDISHNLLSDRQVRNGTLLHESRVKEIQNQPLNFQFSPYYIELTFSNQCNFKCGYCHPFFSSRFKNEIEEFGPYNEVLHHNYSIESFHPYSEENNPFIEAWWKWWPTLSQKLRILRITGGEPLIQISTYKLLDYLDENPLPHLELNINSNLGMSQVIVEKFCQRVNSLLENRKIKSFKLFSSIDTWGPQACYARTGLDLDIFEKNVKTYLELTKSQLTFMITFHVFSVPSFSSLLAKILEWRSLYPQDGDQYHTFHRIRFDINYLVQPLHYNVNILPKGEFVPYMENHLNFITENCDDNKKDKFSFVESQKVLRVLEYMKQTQFKPQKVKEGRKDFYNFFKEHDRRRNTHLIKTFPELEKFWLECESLINN